MRLEDLDYELPPDLIARKPLAERDSSRLLVYGLGDRSIAHRRFSDLKRILAPGDLLILNNTRVIPARLFNTRPSGGRIEVLLLEPSAESALQWTCLVRPGKKVRGELSLHWGQVGARLTRSTEPAQFVIRFSGLRESDFQAWLGENGEPPIPPYLDRAVERDDWDRYQTVFADKWGSVAAPTAGLHFTERLLADLSTRGIRAAFVTLSVGYGTFSALEESQIAAGVLHSEWYEVPGPTLEALRTTRAAGGRVIAVGTTSLRALESMAGNGASGRTDLFIRPGYRFSAIDGLITNFHLPRSSLLALVGALTGLDEMKRCYAEAISERYRFYSYGDAMAILPATAEMPPTSQ